MSGDATPARSEILIGYSDYGQRQGEPMRIELEAIPKHVLACGSTGSGKTVCLKVCAESLLARGIPVVAIDVMGDLAGLAVPAPTPATYQKFGIPEPIGIDATSWELAKTVGERLERLVYARYLTPCSDTGERLAISPLPAKPKYFEEEMMRDRDELELQASSAAWSLMGKIGMKQPRDGIGGEPELVRGLIFEAIMQAWQQDVDLEGVDGIEAFIKVGSQVFEKRMPASQQVRFESGLRSLATGQAARWLEGARLDWDQLFAAPQGKTPLIIIALDQLPKEQHPWVVSQVVNSLASWCSTQSPTPGRPRVALLIDELAGEGGKNSLLPHLTFSSASGTAIRHVLRKGRHWGLGLLAGTQSPSDIDGRSITFFNTIFAGRLKTNHDVGLALSGGSMNEDRLKKISGIIKSSSAPRMFYTMPNGWCDSIKVRWLGTLHSRIERHHLPKLYEMGLLHRSPQEAGKFRWSFHEQVMVDDRHRVVAYVVRERDQILVGVVDSAGTGAHGVAFSWNVEGLLRASCWLSHRAGSRGLHLVGRSHQEREQILLYAQKAEVVLGGRDVPWGMIPNAEASPSGIVGAIHQAVRTQGMLPPLAARAVAA